MKIKIKDIKANPYRNIKHYPIRKEKVAALRESYRATGGVWPNIVARKVNGGAEIAYGHHRTEAARQEYGTNGEIELIDRSLSNAQMLKMMAHDNLEEYGTSAIVTMETVKAVVFAFADGTIKLDAVSVQNRKDVRVAPSFKRVDDGSVDKVSQPVYSTGTIGKFLGWDTENGRYRISLALDALELVEKSVLKESDFADLSQSEAAVTIDEANATLSWREKSKVHAATAVPKAREVATAVATSFKKEKKEGGAAKERASRVAAKIDRRPKTTEMVEKFVEKLNKELSDILSPRDKLTEMLHEVIKVITDVDADARKELHTELVSLANRATELAKMVKSGTGLPKRELHGLLNRS